MSRIFSLQMAPAATVATGDTAASTGSPTPPGTPSPTPLRHKHAQAAGSEAANPDSPDSPLAAAEALQGSEPDAFGCEEDAACSQSDSDNESEIAPGDADLAHADEDVGILYDDADLSLLPQEIWWDQSAADNGRSQLTAANVSTARAQHASANVTAPADVRGPVTDSEDSDASSLSLEPLDTEERVRPIDLDTKWRPVQLHHVLADLRQSEDQPKRVAALAMLEQLVRCLMDCCNVMLAACACARHALKLLSCNSACRLSYSACSRLKCANQRLCAPAGVALLLKWSSRHLS